MGFIAFKIDVKNSKKTLMNIQQPVTAFHIDLFIHLPILDINNLTTSEVLPPAKDFCLQFQKKVHWKVICQLWLEILCYAEHLYFSSLDSASIVILGRLLQVIT